VHDSAPEVLHRARSQGALRDSETVLELALELSALGVGTWDVRSNVIQLDERCHEILGTTLESTQGGIHDYLRLIHPDDVERMRRLTFSAIYQRRIADSEYRIVRPDGVRHIHARAAWLHDEQGEPTRMAAVLRDVTESKCGEEALRASEERFRRAVEEAPFPIMLHAEDGAVLLVNRTWTELSGYGEDELRTIEEWTDRAYGDAAYHVRLRIARLYSSEEPVSEGTFAISTRTGSHRLWEFSSVRLGTLPDGRRLVMSAAVDVTDRDLAKELARSNADLESFAYLASHELQEPLRMVANFVQLLERRYRGKLDDDADRFIHYAVDGAKRMQRLIHDLLSYSRAGREAIADRPTRGEAVLAEAVANLRARIEESGAQISADELPELRGHPGQLVAVLQNLIGNALKYRGEEPPRIHVGAERRGADAVFFVRDNGIGFAPEHAERIFRPFHRLHETGRYSGSGIGLAIVKRIVTRYGGRVWAESQPGHGSTFYFTLPASTDEKGPRRSQSGLKTG
jgi:PAS domain S-box-containing protein